jgi:exonuclease SbcC
MSALLKSISVTDFRSIRGTLSIPLDAPVILVHGQNGTGKTSLLSALELALTGKVPSLYRSDEDYLDHLVHKEAVDAHVRVTVDPSILARADCSIRVHRAQLIGDALLPAPLSAFFNERCYLAQSTMNRLLEIYEGKESRSADSALTKFVKDLLGLDQLDALVNGLFEAGDQRRLKSALAPYKLTLDRLAELKLQINRLNSEIKIADADTTTAEQRVAGELTRLGYQFNQDLTLSGMQDIAVDPSDEVALQQTALLRRNVGAALEQWSSLQTILTGSALSDAEFTGTETANLLAAWRQKEGAEINRVFVAVRNTFSDLPDPELVGPAKAMNEASQAVVKELRRCEDLLNRDVNTSKTLSDLDERLGVTRARLLSLEQQIAGHFEGGGQLAQSLSALLPHIKCEECPVCGRDYSEISDQSLQSVSVLKQFDCSHRLRGRRLNLGAVSWMWMSAILSVGARLTWMNSKRPFLIWSSLALRENGSY